MKEVTLMIQLSLESPNRQELMQDFERSVLISTQIYSTTIVMEYDRNHEIEVILVDTAQVLTPNFHVFFL